MDKKLFCAALSVLSLIILITEANAQCVQCSPQGRKFVCAPASSGGRACVTNDRGMACAVSGHYRAGAAQTLSKGIVLEERLIADIERTEPGFAKALSFLSKRPELLTDGYAKLYLLPTVTDNPGRSIAPKEDGAFAILAQIEASEQNATPVEPTTYEVTLDRAGDSAFATLRVQRLSQKPNVVSPSIVINLMKAERGRWRVSGWDTRLSNN